MKKTLVFVAIATLFAVAAAQEDTVRYQDPWYLFRPLLPEQDGYGYRAEILNGGTCVNGYAILGEEFVWGVAVTADTVWLQSSTENPIYQVMVLRVENSTDAVHRTFTIVDTATFDEYTRRCSFVYPNTGSGSAVRNCFEFYFDRPVPRELILSPQAGMSDSVFVGRYYGHNGHSAFMDEYAATRNERDMDAGWWCSTTMDGKSPTTFEAVNMYLAHGMFDNGRFWCFPHNPSWGLLFPIVRLRCTRPAGVRVAEVGYDGFTLAWRPHSEAEAFQVRLVQEGLPFDSAAVYDVDASDTTFGFEGLSRTTSYLYQVRKSCRYATATYDTVVWSQWSDAKRMRIESIGIASAGTTAFGLRPNPATDMATVELGLPAEAGTAVEVLDMAGRRVLSQPVDLGASRFGLDLRGLDAGVYMVSLTTPQGVATRRLVKR